MGYTKFKYRDWEIEVDKKATQYLYSNFKHSSSESCGCAHCINYIKNIAIVFPVEIQNLFDNLGIDKKKELEVSHMARLNNDLHYYCGWFHFKGNFKGKDYSIPLQNGNGRTLELEPITNEFGIGFTKKICNPAFEDKTELVQVEFECKIPWVIDKELETDY